MPTINCLVAGDPVIHRIPALATTTLEELKSRVALVSPVLSGVPNESFAICVAQRRPGVWLCAHDREVKDIKSASNLQVLHGELADRTQESATVDELLSSSPGDGTIIHLIAVPLGDAKTVMEYTHCICWLRRLLVAAGVAFVPSSIWAGVQSVGGQPVGIAGCVAGACTALASGLNFAIPRLEARKVRAAAEASQPDGSEGV